MPERVRKRVRRRLDAPDRIGQRLSCLAIHAEGLESDPVWLYMTHFVRFWTRWGIPPTIFVCPIRAINASRDIRSRLRWLAEMGCEIGQHTHFYSIFRDDGARIEKTTSLTTASVHRNLDRDFESLARAGLRPR